MVSCFLEGVGSLHGKGAASVLLVGSLDCNFLRDSGVSPLRAPKVQLVAGSAATSGTESVASGGAGGRGPPELVLLPGASEPRLPGHRHGAGPELRAPAPVLVRLGLVPQCRFDRFLFGGRVLLLKETTEKRYPYSNLSTGGPRQGPTFFPTGLLAVWLFRDVSG